MSQSAQELGDIISSWVANSMIKVPEHINVEGVYHKSINDFVFMSNENEMLRVSEDGFWVRGQRLEQDASEAATVYRAFRQWLIWAQLNRE